MRAGSESALDTMLASEAVLRRDWDRPEEDAAWAYLHAAAGGERVVPRILIVEDDELNRDSLRRLLRRRGFEIVLAVDGNEGVAAAGAEAPDLILMDMSLPGIDGWEATRRLKDAPETRAIPIIALTAHAMASDRDKALAAGCDDYDTKPIDLERLLPKIQALLPESAGG